VLLRIGPSDGFLRNRNEPTGSIKGGESEKLYDYQLFNKDSTLCDWLRVRIKREDRLACEPASEQRTGHVVVSCFSM
jgi:hypothetical protein